MEAIGIDLIIPALKGTPIMDVKEEDFNHKVVNIMRDAYVCAGQALPDTKTFIENCVQICKSLSSFTSRTMEEVELIVRHGALGNFENFIILSASSVNRWLREYARSMCYANARLTYSKIENFPIGQNLDDERQLRRKFVQMMYKYYREGRRFPLLWSDRLYAILTEERLFQHSDTIRREVMQKATGLTYDKYKTLCAEDQRGHTMEMEKYFVHRYFREQHQNRQQSIKWLA